MEIFVQDIWYIPGGRFPTRWTNRVTNSTGHSLDDTVWLAQDIPNRHGYLILPANPEENKGALLCMKVKVACTP